VIGKSIRIYHNSEGLAYCVLNNQGSVSYHGNDHFLPYFARREHIILDTFTDSTRDALRETTLIGRLYALDAIYDRVQRVQAAFQKTAAACGAPIACPADCGTCCVHFVPDAMPVEMDRIAFYLLTERKDLIDYFIETMKTSEGRDAACPFRDPDAPGKNCMVYPVRPLICRLFGFCSVNDKSGEAAFSLCREMPPLSGTATRNFAGSAAMKELFGAIPPPMSDFSMEIVGLDPQEAGRRSTLYDGLPPSLSKVSLLVRLAKSE